MAAFKKKIKVMETKWFWAYWILGAAMLLLGVFLMPVWSDTSVFWRTWSTGSINIILFVLVALYMVYLVAEVSKQKVRARVVVGIIEIATMFVIAVLCLLQQFDILSLIGPSFVIGYIIWARGCIIAIDAFLLHSNKKGGLAKLIVGLVLASLGAACLARRATKAPVFIWAISIALIIVAFGVILLGVFSIPKKKKVSGQ